jgi:hypothetical protein
MVQEAPPQQTGIQIVFTCSRGSLPDTPKEDKHFTIDLKPPKG